VLLPALATLGLACGGSTPAEPVNDLAAAWSPDGRQLVFDHPRDGDTEIYVQSDGRIKRLTNNDDSDYYPSWSPDGRRIAFLSDRDDHRAQLFVMSSDGSDPERVTGADDGVIGQPAWTPDSSRLGYTELSCSSGVLGGICRGTIKIVDLESERTTTIAKANYIDMRDPSFARDGRLAFAGNDEFNLQGMYVASADGRRRRPVGGELGGEWPAWSPDGRRLAYQCGYAVCLVNADGTGERFLRRSPAERPAWSPDGRRIVYACGKPVTAPTASRAGSLCVVSVGSGRSRRLHFAWPR
jgi:Tol biopolymer transport system component